MSGKDSKEEFSIDKSGVLIKYNGRGGDIVIPEGVSVIGKQAFYNCKTVTSVTIPKGVVSISEDAFIHCNGLTRVTLPEGLKELGEYAFGYTGLTHVTLPASVGKIAETAFWSCTELTEILVEEGNPAFCSLDGFLVKKRGGVLHTFPEEKKGAVVIPEGVKELCESLCEEHGGITSLTLPESLRKIGKGAFGECTGLTSVTIPEGVEKIEGAAFSGCSSLTSITIPPKVTKIEKSTYSRCAGLTSVVIPEGVTEIEEFAFSECTNLASITIPSTVKKVGLLVFSECPNLTSITLLTRIKGQEHWFMGGDEAFENLTLAAPSTPPDYLVKAARPALLRGFAKLYWDGAEMDPEIRASYLSYIEKQGAALVPLAVVCLPLLRLMFAEKMLDRKDVKLLLDEADRQGSFDAKAEILNFSQNLAPVSLEKEFKL